ncbi:glycerophosphoryl diester phosphodiesterase [Granulicella mallensis]|uniref:Glycerophosphoryl diester phosphodiesterase n=1 Tax=Granulicella mallensis TaxID=940614 RepID=A0A7W8EBD4_9BACT|nr:glycerophosphoryl diester phosphodiesterase [Granulicella mallensis]
MLGFFIEKENGISRSRALSAFDVLRSILEGYWDVLSPELATTLKEVYRALPDRNGGLFCDVPMIHLWAEAALYQLGFPYHVNTRHHWRATYKAKARRMYIDSFVLDQCRSFYDRMPMIELHGKILSKFDMQVMSRICIDAICKARGEMVPQLYSGGNLGRVHTIG